MNEVWEFLKELVDPKSIIQLGLPLLLFVIFAETGLFFGFFLPGDSLVFISGLFCATKKDLIGVNIVVLILLMIAVAVLGNIVGYLFGKRFGKNLFKKEDSFFFKKRHLIATQNFYEKHGRKTLIMGRFLPYVRTFAPILAGIIHLDFRKFMLFNIVGAFAWIGSIASIGYFLGSKFPETENYLGYIVIGLIVITTAPVIFTYLKGRKKGNQI